MSPQQKAAQEAANFVEKLNDAILFPIIYLLMSVAFLVFIYGLAEYVFGAANEQKRTQGRSHMMYGVIGLVVMISAWSLLSVVAGTFGLSDELDCANNPSDPSCIGMFGGGIPGGPTPGAPVPGGPTPGAPVPGCPGC